MAFDSREASPDELSPERREHDALLTRLVGMFEESEQATQASREKAERDRDYYDNKQLTIEEEQELKRRGQPPIGMNLIRSWIAYHLGMEKKQRRDPKAYGRGPSDQQSAEIATEALRYAMERTDYSSERSRAWEFIKIEGCGALECTMIDRPDGNKDVKWLSIAWDRFFHDPHSARPDFTDARYLGQVQWMDEDEVLTEYENAAAAIELTFETATGKGLGTTYDDRPRWEVWADPKRKRLRVVQVWWKERGSWQFAEFVRSGILATGESPYRDDQGESLCGIVAESCYVDRDNNRYGEIRDLIDAQDEVNKRRSKALHLLNQRTVITEVGSIPDGDKEQARREVARPEGWVEVTRGARFDIDKNVELAQGQMLLGEQAREYIQRAGANAALRGKGTETQSGRAIQAQQAGGLIELGDGLDVLRRLDHRVFKQTWFAIKQYWAAPMWIRVTEDPEAPRFVGINIPPEMQQQIQGQDPEMQLSGSLAEADVDIQIEDAPDVPTLDTESFAAMTDVLKNSGGDPLMLKFLAETHPGLRSATRRKLIKLADERMQMMQQQAEAAAKAEQQKAQGDLAVETAKLKQNQEELEVDTTFRAAELALKATEPPKPAPGAASAAA